MEPKRFLSRDRRAFVTSQEQFLLRTKTVIITIDITEIDKNKLCGKSRVIEIINCTN